MSAPAVPPRDADTAVRLCEAMCRSLASAYRAAGLDQEDLRQAARIGAWKAWRDWRPDRGSSFAGFARLCIQRELITVCKAAQRLKHASVNQAVRFEAPIGDDDLTLADVVGGSEDPTHERVEDRETLRRALWALELQLSPLERDVVVGIVFAGESYTQLAERLNVRVKTIDNAMQRGRHKLSGAAEVPARHRGGVYVARQDQVTPNGLGYVTAADAIAVARGRLGETYLDAQVVSCVKSALGPDGRERRDTRGRPRADGRRPIAVWRIVLERSDLPMRLAA